MDRASFRNSSSGTSEDAAPTWHDRAAKERRVSVGMTVGALVASLGNPINSLAMHAQLLVRRLEKVGSADANVRESLSTIEAEILRLSRLFAGFRTLELRSPLEPVSTDVPALVHSVIAAVGRRISEQNVALEVEVAPASSSDFFDRERLAQLLGHLLDNALDAMPEGGNLTLETRAADDRLEIVVADTGPGLPEDIEPFEPFATTIAGRDGLGLFFARRIALLHRGTLVYRADPSGTAFELTLPRHRNRGRRRPT